MDINLIADPFANFMGNSYYRWLDEYKYEHDEFKDVFKNIAEKVSKQCNRKIEIVKLSTSSRYWVEISVEGESSTFRFSETATQWKMTERTPHS